MTVMTSRVPHCSVKGASKIYAVDALMEKGTKSAFQCFLWFSVVVFIAPQNIFPALSVFGIGKIAMLFALAFYGRFAFSQGQLSVVTGSELKLLGAFLLLCLASVSYSLWPGGSLEFFMDFVWKAGVVFFLVANLLVSEERARALCWSFVLFAAVNSIVGLQNWQSGNMIGGTANRIDGGFAGLASNPNDLGLLLDISLPLVWYAYSTATTMVTRFAALMTIGIAILTIIVTFSRGAFLGLVVIAGVFVWKVARGKRLRVLLIVALVFPVLLATLPQGYSDRILSIFQSDMDETGSREERIKLMEAGVKSMIEHPLGVGVGMNILTAADAGVGWHVIHNAYLQVGVELGIVGFILYLLLIWVSYRGLASIERAAHCNIADLALAIRLSLIAYVVVAMFGPVAYNFYFFYLGGMAVALKGLVRRAPHILSPIKAEEG